MNRLVIIGNGFDLAHGIKTDYTHFICWFLDGYFVDIFENGNASVLDRQSLLELNMRIFYDHFSGERIIFGKKEYEQYKQKENKKPWEFLSQLHNEVEGISIKKSLLFEKVLSNIESKGWTDIESDYYELLKENINDINYIKLLNKQLNSLCGWLAEYLSTIKQPKSIDAVKQALNAPVHTDDVSTLEIKKDEEQLKDIPEEEFIKMDKNTDLTYDFAEDIMLLSFNYTHTAKMYLDDTTHINYIHGSLDNPNEIIFGYGDEMDKDFQDLIDRNENELLSNSKSIKYLETSHYRKLLEFIEGGPFQVYIMGHSCGNSDRTLLNTIFEHPNCISIKPFCYINNKGEDNYSELTRNIYRNFTDKKLFRDRVVNKERCTTLEGKYLIKRKKQVEEEKQNK